MDRRGIFGDRRDTERRERSRPFRPANEDRRSGQERRADERRTETGDRRQREAARHHPQRHQPRAAERTTALPPVSRLLAAAVVVAVSMLDLFVASTTSYSAWGLVVVASAIPIASFALRAPRQWHLPAVWFAVGVYLAAAAVHIAYLLTR
jgi:hypothetical protein